MGGDDYKKKRQEAMSRVYRETYGVPLSMGCSTDKVVCAHCGPLGGGPACEHVAPVMEGYPIGRVSSLKISPDRDIKRIHELGISGGIEFGGRSSGVAGKIVDFLYVTTVPAPRCGGCGQPMRGVQGTAWACTNKVCSEVGKSVETGIGMMTEVSDG